MSKNSVKLAYFVHESTGSFNVTVYENPRVRTLCQELATCTVDNWGDEESAAKHRKRLAMMAAKGATHTVDSIYGNAKLHLNFYKYENGKTSSASFDWGGSIHEAERALALAKRLDTLGGKKLKHQNVWETQDTLEVVLQAAGAVRMGEYKSERYYRAYVLPVAAGGSDRENDYSLTATDSH